MPHPTLDSLRQQLRERFPGALPRTNNLQPPLQTSTTHTISACFIQGSITELNSPTHSAGLHLLVAALLNQEPTPTTTPELALIDANDQFDPASFPASACLKLLWLRCQTPLQALQACDLLLRDGNLPRIILDLSLCPRHHLNTLPKSAWYRFNQSIQTSRCSLLALTPQPLIPCATRRLEVARAFDLSDFSLDRNELLERFMCRETDRQACQASNS